MEDREDLAFQLEKALKECDSLRAENERLKKLLGLSPEKKDSLPRPITSDPPSVHPVVSNDSGVAAKISLFRSLFRGREDVYPLRWESKNGNSGYSPAVGIVLISAPIFVSQSVTWIERSWKALAMSSGMGYPSLIAF